MLTRIGEMERGADFTPRKISIDAMVIEYEKGETADRLGCITASNHHEVVVYEDRGENLDYLKAPRHDTATNPTDCWGDPIPNSITQSGSERLQQRQSLEQPTASSSSAGGTQPTVTRTRTLVDAFKNAAKNIFNRGKNKELKLQDDLFGSFSGRSQKSSGKPQSTRTRADMGQVGPPCLRPGSEPIDHIVNAFLEFRAIIIATRKVNLDTCSNILQSFRLNNKQLLKVRLEEADAAIYNNETSEVIEGKMTGRYMAAYSATSGFVILDERETERTGHPRYVTPQNDPIVVTAHCTKIMLDDKILEMADTVSETLDIEKQKSNWSVPKICWANGVPGCGKTSWAVRHFDVEKDVMVTTTTEAAKDIKEKLAQRIGNKAKAKVRTMASILANGFRRSDRCNRLLIDEAHMNHFGAIVMAVRLSGADEVFLIGDVNQLPYIDRENLFELRYRRPDLVATVGQELMCTHRNPIDVAYTLREVYSGIYSARSKVHSLKLERYTGSQIPKTVPNTLFLVHTQDEKEHLISQGFGTGTGSRTLTIHEAQGLTYESVFIIRTMATKLRLHDSVPHAVVAVSRHTNTCVYYTDFSEDAVGRFVIRAMNATAEKMVDYNLKMAIKSRDAPVVEALLRCRGAAPS